MYSYAAVSEHRARQTVALLVIIFLVCVLLFNYSTVPSCAAELIRFARDLHQVLWSSNGT